MTVISAPNPGRLCRFAITWSAHNCMCTCRLIHQLQTCLSHILAFPPTCMLISRYAAGVAAILSIRAHHAYCLICRDQCAQCWCH